MRELKLKNGIPVVLVPVKGTDVVTALIVFKVGSRNETKSINGISHFVEHLFFKGTERRPSTLAISKELDGIGADFNAFTGKDLTGYYIKVQKRHAKVAIDMLEDILFHPIFDAEEIDRERGVIIEEINMYEDNPMAIAEELSEQLLFGANHPLGFRIAGPKENILNVSRNDIISYRNKYYHPNNMTIVLAGNVSAETVSQLRKHFEANSRTTKRRPKHRAFSFSQRSARIHLEKKQTAQAHLALSFPGPTYSSKDICTAQLLSTVLGGNMSSRLFINVRERKGLCYYITSGVSPYEDMGAFTIRAGFDTTRIHEAIQAITQEVQDITTNTIPEKELRKAKEFIRGKMSLKLEDSESVAAWWAKEALFRRTRISPQQYISRIQRVTATQVQSYAQKHLRAQHANLVIIGPYTNRQQQSFKKHLKF